MYIKVTESICPQSFEEVTCVLVCDGNEGKLIEMKLAKMSFKDVATSFRILADALDPHKFDRDMNIIHSILGEK